MKIRVVLHYFLFLAIVVGAFAAMAQNDYGLIIIAYSCFLMSIILLLEFLNGWRVKNIPKLVELLGLTLLFSLFGLRALYIHFAFVELILLASCIMLIATYFLDLRNKYGDISGGNIVMKRLILLYYLGIIGFLISIMLTLYLPILGEPFGVFSSLMLGLLILGIFRYKSLLINGERVQTGPHLVKNAGHSLILVTGFLMISFYTGLSMFNLLPNLYTSKLPNNYINLISEAETGTEEPVDGKYQYQLYEEAYNKFLERHGEN